MSEASPILFRGLNPIFVICCYSLLATILFDSRSYQQDTTFPLKAEPLTIDLYHKFHPNQEFKLRGSILVRPKTEYRVAQASILNQAPLSESDLKALKSASDQGEAYHLKAALRQSKDLVDFITVNLGPFNDFISVNLFTINPECNNPVVLEPSTEFNTTILVESGSIAPSPDTATYVKRLEEERQSKQRDGKEDDRSFFAKYWIYIVPAVIILMIFSGPEQGSR